jgi:hypothetical protein
MGSIDEGQDFSLAERSVAQNPLRAVAGNRDV